MIKKRIERNKKIIVTATHTVHVVEKRKPIPIVCMCYLPYSSLIAVCTADCRITFYGIFSTGMRTKGQMKSKRELLVLGKDDGSVDVIAVTPELMHRVFDIKVEKSKQELERFNGVRS